MPSHSRGWLAAAFAATILTALAGATMPAAAESCSTRAGQCDAICASRPPVPPYTSTYDRCAESCQPRWNQCLRTGIWTHLEDARAGWRERVARF